MSVKVFLRKKFVDLTWNHLYPSALCAHPVDAESTENSTQEQRLIRTADGKEIRLGNLCHRYVTVMYQNTYIRGFIFVCFSFFNMGGKKKKYRYEL